jgi:hypothetical protein
MKWEIIQNNSSCIVCATLLDCWTEGYIHRYLKGEVLLCNVSRHEITTNLGTFTSWSDKFGQKHSVRTHLCICAHYIYIYIYRFGRFIAYNLKKGNEMECKFIICHITYYSVCKGGVSLLFVPTQIMSVHCLSNTKTWNLFSFLQLISLFLSFSKLKFHFQYLKSTNWSIQEYETKSGFVALP